MKEYIFILSLFLLSCKGKQEKTSLSNNETDLLQTANNFYYKEKYELAKRCFDTLVVRDSVNGEYYYKRGYSKYMLLTDDRGAILDFLSSIKYNYKNKKGAYLTIGTLYRILSKYDSSIYFYNKSLAEDPNYEKAKKEKMEVLKLIEGSR